SRTPRRPSLPGGGQGGATIRPWFVVRRSWFGVRCYTVRVTKPVRVDYERVEFEIYKESILQRLDIYIHKRMPEYSRTLVQKLIKDGMITVNGHTSKPAYEINLGDRIVCELPRLIQPHVVASNITLEIVHEDEHLIAINKPP